ncbi:hypothetical protein N301_16066, partial [Charadrius vociferus]
WPLTMEKLQHLNDLIHEQLQLGHIVPTHSPWNTPVFVIKKKSGKWRLLQDLRAVNVVLEDMGPLQQGVPSPTLIPTDWPIIVIDLQDCFFTTPLPLHPADAKWFIFSVPSINMAEPSKRYHWTVLPQGMKGPTICQWYEAQALSPVREMFQNCVIYHYMDDILLAAPSDKQLNIMFAKTRDALSTFSLVISPEKIQQMLPLTYLGWKIAEKKVGPPNIRIDPQISTLNELQKLLGTINWICPLLGLSTEELSPLFNLL